MFTFNPDDSVNVEPIIIDFQKRKEIEKRAILFFTGLKREADFFFNKAFLLETALEILKPERIKKLY